MEAFDMPTDTCREPGLASLPVTNTRCVGSLEFLSRFAHELRTPLQVVLGYSELLGREALPPDHIEAVQAIQSAGRHLLELATDMLDLGMAESGHMRLRLEAIDCSDLLTDVAVLIKPLAAEKAVSVVVEAASASVVADRRRLVQVLLNLLTNSVKFSPDHANVTLSCFGPNGGRVRFEVRDSGPGIPPEGLARIFRPFERLAPDLPGSGLGLAICRSLVEGLGGTLEAISSLGTGSTFWFDLPVTEIGLVAAPRSVARRASSGSFSA